MARHAVPGPLGRRLIASFVVAAFALGASALGTRAYGPYPYIVTLKASPSGDVSCTASVQITATILFSDSGNPQEGQSVNWAFKTSLNGQDSVSPPTSVTNSQGNASTTLQFGPAEGQRTVSAKIAQKTFTINVSCHGGVPSPTPSPTPNPTPTPGPPTPTPTPTAIGSSEPTPTGSTLPSPSGQPLPSTSELPIATPTNALPPTALPTAPGIPTAGGLPGASGSISPGGAQPAASSTSDMTLPIVVIIVLVIAIGGAAALVYTRRR